jgi:(1->4)-alpha-D-glucan 1-alpha-D-glucosylmutase
VREVSRGCEIPALWLGAPQTRRAVYYSPGRARLARLDAGEPARDLDDEKLLVVSRALRLRRDRPAVFGAGSGYRPLAATTDRVVAFERHGEDAAGSVVTVAARLPLSIGDAADATVGLPDGSWTDVLSGESYAGPARVGDLLASLPVALLVRDGG